MSLSDCTDTRRRVWGELNRAPGSEEGQGGQIAGKWFIIEPNFTNTPSTPKQPFLLTTAIPETGTGLRVISLFSSFYLN